MGGVPIVVVDELRTRPTVVALGLTRELLDGLGGSVGADGLTVLDGLGDAPDAVRVLRRYLIAGRPDADRLTRPGAVERIALGASDGPRLVLLTGFGDGSPGALRRAGAAIARAALDEPDAGSLLIVGGAASPDSSAAVVEGLLLGGYRFRADGAPTPVVRVALPGADRGGRSRGQAYGEATAWARDLINTRSSVKTPAWLAEQARSELVPRGVDVIERDVEWLAEHRFGGVLAVGAGSSAPPRLIEARWNPRGARPGHVVLVGKSITFDSGGLNIKPLESMNSMYSDMAGGAVVLAAVRLAAELELPIKVTGLLPAAENSVSGSAMRQNDVIRHYGGRTSEIVNTDAEGRLVLADGLAYAAARLKPTTLIDLATLTGAMKVALGTRTGGLFASSDELAAQLIAAGAAAGEPLWRLPLDDGYRSSLNSDIADMNNSPGNPGAITAALYLRPFAAGLPWAHLDIAGPARSSDQDGELNRGGTGFGARLLAAYLTGLG